MTFPEIINEKTFSLYYATLPKPVLNFLRNCFRFPVPAKFHIINSFPPKFLSFTLHLWCGFIRASYLSFLIFLFLPNSYVSPYISGFDLSSLQLHQFSSSFSRQIFTLRSTSPICSFQPTVSSFLISNIFNSVMQN